MSHIIRLHSLKCTVIVLCARVVVSGYNLGRWSPFTTALAHNSITVHLDYALQMYYHKT